MYKKSWIQRGRALSLLMLATILFLSMSFTSAAQEQEEMAAEMSKKVLNDVELAVQLGIIRGSGQGVTDDYLALGTTRVQAAIMFLRMSGLEEEALAYEGDEQFSDGHLTGGTNQNILSYLKANPELGWIGSGNNRFDPRGEITAQQFYKVMLEALGYKQDADFEYANTLDFAASIGMNKISDITEFKNIHITTASIEALNIKIKGTDQTLTERLISQGVLDEDKTTPLLFSRVEIMQDDELGGYLTDDKGKTLYYFTKDIANPNACMGNCITNWPIYYQEEMLLDASLNVDDFDSFEREDGEMQTTYKGWPVYYFAADENSGDVKGEGAGNVWYVLKSPNYSVMLGTQEEFGTYLTDAAGQTLYYFDLDVKGESACSGNCIVNWPAFYDASIQVPSALSKDDFSSIEREDGSMQSTFKGYPLYYFIQDENAGEVKGHNFKEVWFVIQPTEFMGTTAEAAAEEENEAEATGVDHVIKMEGYAFSNKELTIKVGDSVTFENMDADQHNAVAENGAFEGPLLDQGETFTFVFEEPGVYEYYCAPHSSHMKGKIIVE